MTRNLLLLLYTPVLLAVQPAQIPVTPIAFEPNVGQAASPVKFLAHTRQATVWMTQREVVLGGVKIRFEGGAANPRIEGEERLGSISNYFAGNDRSSWHTDVPNFAKVRYREVYRGIDVVFYGNPGRLEYDFVLRAGADPERIRLKFAGSESVRVDGGDLVVKGAKGEMRNLSPAIMQDGKKVKGRWVVNEKNQAGFVVEGYDRAKPLVIDPVLTYASYLGGSENQQVTGVTIDAQGNILVCGYTDSDYSFPTVAALYPQSNADTDQTNYSFVAKFNPAASGAASLVYSTYFATGGVLVQGSRAWGITTDSSGNAYFVGDTWDNLPLVNPLQGQSTYLNANDCATGGLGSGDFPCRHGYIAKLSPTGSQLLFSTYLGGSDDDSALAIVLDHAGDLYITGSTESTDFPLMGNYVQEVLRGIKNPNAFVTEISSTYQMKYSTFFGANGLTQGHGIAVDSSGNVYFSGSATGPALPITAGAYQAVYPGGANQPSAGFVAIVNPAQSPSLVYSTYLGGVDYATALYGVAADGKGNVYVAGASEASNYPVTPATDIRGPSTADFSKAVVTELNPSMQGSGQLVYSTIVDGSYMSSANGIVLDAQNKIWIAGYSSSINFPTTANAFQPLYAGEINSSGLPTALGMVAQIDPTQSGLAALLYATFLGGPVVADMNAIAMDAAGKTIAVAGYVETSSPVTLSGFQTAYSGGADAYLARFDLTQTGPLTTNVENGASLSADTIRALSPGLIFTIKGTGLGPSIAQGGAFDPATGKVSTNVAGVQVLVNNVACPLLYLSSTQINAIAPYELASQVGNLVPVEVIYNKVLGSVVYEEVEATAPGIFSFDDGSGQGAILNQDSSVNGASNAAARGTIVQIFASGEGQTNPPGVDGAIANEPVGQIPAPVAPVSVTIGGVATAAPVYAGTLPGGVAGAFQIDVTVPANAPTGSAVPVVLTIGKNSSPMTLTMAIQ